MSRIRLRAVVGLLTALFLPVGVEGADVPGSDRAASPPGASEAIAAAVLVEKSLLREDLAQFERAAAGRSESAARLQELYATLDEALLRSETGTPQGLDLVLSEIESGENERSARHESERALVERIRERMRRIDLLEEQVDALQARAAEAAGPLTARWEVVLLPGSQRGVFQLTQAGTLVSGTYTLDGGWSGSLRGTLVNRKVFLERIDSKLGRSGEFEGYLSGDGSQIRGTWLRYDVSTEGASSGQWSATRRTAAP